MTAELSATRVRWICWRDPKKARAWGWEATLGAGPFEVVGVVDHGDCGLGLGLVLRTGLGEHEVPGVWLEPAA
jgi:hypothetical protein